MDDDNRGGSWKIWVIGFVLLLAVFLAFSIYFMEKKNRQGPRSRSEAGSALMHVVSG